MTDRAPAPDAGVVAWVAVDDVDAALARPRRTVAGCSTRPSPDGPTRVLTTVADPSGNPVGLVSHAGGVQE